jgi:hypothetical protein
VAHAGGFVAGTLLGGLLTIVSRAARKTLANLAAGFCFSLLVIVPWWLALAHLKANSV